MPFWSLIGLRDFNYDIKINEVTAKFNELKNYLIRLKIGLKVQKSQ